MYGHSAHGHIKQSEDTFTLRDINVHDRVEENARIQRMADTSSTVMTRTNIFV